MYGMVNQLTSSTILVVDKIQMLPTLVQKYNIHIPGIRIFKREYNSHLQSHARNIHGKETSLAYCWFSSPATQPNTN
jgi:hypothetical protein